MFGNSWINGFCGGGVGDVTDYILISLFSNMSLPMIMSRNTGHGIYIVINVCSLPMTETVLLLL